MSLRRPGGGDGLHFIQSWRLEAGRRGLRCWRARRRRRLFCSANVSEGESRCMGVKRKKAARLEREQRKRTAPPKKTIQEAMNLEPFMNPDTPARRNFASVSPLGRKCPMNIMDQGQSLQSLARIPARAHGQTASARSSARSRAQAQAPRNPGNAYHRWSLVSCLPPLASFLLPKSNGASLHVRRGDGPPLSFSLSSSAHPLSLRVSRLPFTLVIYVLP